MKEKVPYSGQKTVSLKCVCSFQNVNNATVSTARLVPKGFEKSNHEEIPMDSPTCHKEELRTMLAINAKYQWKSNAIVIKIVVLQGDKTDREVFVMRPE